MSALDQHVWSKVEEMRSELAEIRLLLNAQLRSDVEATELLGQLLQDTRARLDAVEQSAPDQHHSGSS